MFVAAQAFSSCREWGLLSGFSAPASHGSGSRGWEAWPLGAWASAVAVRGCRSCGLWSTASVVVVQGFSCSVVCGIFPNQGLNPCPLHWQADSLPLSHQGSPFFGLKSRLCKQTINWGVFPLLLVSKTISERLGYFFFMYLAELISDDIWTPKF